MTGSLRSPHAMLKGMRQSGVSPLSRAKSAQQGPFRALGSENPDVLLTSRRIAVGTRQFN